MKEKIQENGVGFLAGIVNGILHLNFSPEADVLVQKVINGALNIIWVGACAAIGTAVQHYVNRHLKRKR